MFSRVRQAQSAGRRRDIMFVLLLSILFLTIAVPGSRVAGTVDDEASLGLFGMNLIEGTDVQIEGKPNRLNIFGRKIIYPTNFLESVDFSMRSYLLIPFFLVFGVGLNSIKLLALTTSLGLLILCYIFVRKYYGFAAACITVLLAVLSPHFIHAARIGVLHQEIMINFFLAASGFCLIAYSRNGRTGALTLAALLAGLTMSMKLSAPARFVGAAAAALIIYPGRTVSLLKTLRIKRMLAAAVLFCCGAILFIHYNVASRGESFKYLGKVMFEGKLTYGNVSVFNVVNNIGVRMGQVKKIVSESSGYRGLNFWPYWRRTVAREGMEDYLFILFMVSLLASPVLTRLKGSPEQFRITMFIYITIGVMVLISAFSPGSLDAAHLGLIFPFPQFVFALFATKAAAFLPSNRLALPAFLLLLWPYPVLLVRYKAFHDMSGGVRLGSPASYPFIDYLIDEQPQPLYMLDDQAQILLSFLSRDRAPRISGWFYYVDGQGFHSDILTAAPLNERLKHLDRKFEESDEIYVIFPDHEDTILPEAKNILLQTLEDGGYGFESVMETENEFGRNILTLYVIRKPGLQCE